MNVIEQATRAFWRYAQDRAHPPGEWANRFSRDDAYRILLSVLARRVEAGERQAGWKVGATARAMRAQQKAAEPAFGVLFESGQIASGSRISFDSLIEPGFENELLLTLGSTLRGPGVTPEAAQAALSSMSPAFEIIEKRVNFTGDSNVIIADNAQQRAYVVGTSVPLPPGFDLGNVELELKVNEVEAERAFGREVLGSPAASLAWLANKLADFGLALEAGMKVMSGSFTRQYNAHRGDQIEANFCGVGVVHAEFR
jgi:2-keto-4-pentenoate hydratase